MAPAVSSVTRNNFHHRLAKADGKRRANGAVIKAGEATMHNSTNRRNARNMKRLEYYVRFFKLFFWRMYAATYHFSQKVICLLRYDEDNDSIYSGLFTNFSMSLSSSS